VAHPGNVIDYRVNVTKPDDLVMQGIGNFDDRSEQYYLHVDPAIEVLATTTFDGAYDPWTRHIVMPVAWKKHFGAARCSIPRLATPPLNSTIRKCRPSCAGALPGPRADRSSSGTDA
jgi:type 1 glutamine amidotransferase